MSLLWGKRQQPRRRMPARQSEWVGGWAGNVGKAAAHLHGGHIGPHARDVHDGWVLVAAVHLPTVQYTNDPFNMVVSGTRFGSACFLTVHLVHA